MYQDDFLQKKLDDRIFLNSLRILPEYSENMIDFSYNDYLGLATNHLTINNFKDLSHGSKGSRLLSGNYPLIEKVEEQLADFHDAESGLIFNSGYDANIGLLSCIANRFDTILYDEYCHASIRDGIRLSYAKSHSFHHNDMHELKKKLSRVTGTVFIVTESIFSMDGDACPLEELVALAEKYKANIILDEAHATGVIGEHGEGLAQHLKLQSKIFARVHTFGKACGTHGAIVLGSEKLKSFLINFARSFIYTTAIPEAAVFNIMQSYKVFPTLKKEREILKQHIQQFQSAKLRYPKLLSHSAIQGVLVPGNEAIKTLANTLSKHKLDVRPILYPTVARGSERLRIVLHSFNTTSELNTLISLLS